RVAHPTPLPPHHHRTTPPTTRAPTTGPHRLVPAGHHPLRRRRHHSAPHIHPGGTFTGHRRRLQPAQLPAAGHLSRQRIRRWGHRRPSPRTLRQNCTRCHPHLPGCR